MVNRDCVFDLVLNALEDQEFECDADLLREYISVNNLKGRRLV